jgi:hypothetical protein
MSRWFDTLIRILTGIMIPRPAVVYSSPVLNDPHETLNASAPRGPDTELKLELKPLADQRADTVIDRAFKSVCCSPGEMVLS